MQRHVLSAGVAAVGLGVAVAMIQISPALAGTVVKGITSPKASVILGPWQQTEIYLNVGQGFHSNDVRGALTTVDALQTILDRGDFIPALPDEDPAEPPVYSMPATIETGASQLEVVTNGIPSRPVAVTIN